MKRNCAFHSQPWFWMVLVALLLRVIMILVFQTYDIAEAVWSKSPHETAIPHFSFGCETGAIAKALATGKGFAAPFGGDTGPTAWIAPLYPSLCALIFKLFGVYTNASAFVILLVNSVFSALTCIPLYRIAERTLGRTCGLCAGWIFACGVMFMRWPTTYVWEVSLSALLLTTAFWVTLLLAERSTLKRWTLFGLFWGCTALTNPALLTFLPLSALWIAYHLSRRRQQWLRPITVMVFVFIAMISPWLVRNRLVFHKWVFIRSNAPFEFSLGNYHGSNGLGWFGKHPTRNTREWNQYARLGEVAYVSLKGGEALRFVQNHPREFLSITGRRFWAMWYGTHLDYVPIENEPWRPWIYWPLSLATLLGLIAITVRGERAAWLLTAVILLYPTPYYLTFVQERYRHAIEPLMLLVSSYMLMGLATDLEKRFSKKRSGRSAKREEHDLEPACTP